MLNWKKDEDTSADDLLDRIFDSSDKDRDKGWLYMPIQVGTWGTNHKTAWEERLDYTSDYVIQKTGMNRNELKKLLQYLDDHNIIR